MNKISSTIVTLPSSVLNQCQSKVATREVLGSLMLYPQLIKDYPLEVTDFVGSTFKIIYSAIFNLARNGAQSLDVPALESYLKENYLNKYKIYAKNNGSNFLQDAMELCNPQNYSMYYEEIKKYALLRSYLENGIDVGEFFNPEEVDPEVQDKIQDNFQNITLNDLADHYKSKIARLNDIYELRDKHSSIKAGGEGAKAQKELWKKNSNYGVSYASNLLTHVTDGIKQKRFVVISAGTGLGKTRMTMANIGHTFAPEFWNDKEKRWQVNPNGTRNKCLYIGTEMELRTEVEPILEAYIAKVPEDHILHPDRYEEGEEERVDKAIDIMTSGFIYMEYLPDYNLQKLEKVISKHVNEHGVNHVFFDYIHLTASLSAEYSRSSGLKDREDLVLANVSTKLKEWTDTYNISIDTWTQVNGDFAQDAIRDQRLVRGSKAIIDKADVAGIMSKPSEAELRKIDPYLRNCIIRDRLICLSIYKNRGSKFSNVKLWLDVEYDTMRVHDLFGTDYSYLYDDEIKQVTVHVNEDSDEVTHYESFEMMQRALGAAGVLEDEDVENKKDLDAEADEIFGTPQFVNVDDLEDSCDGED